MVLMHFRCATPNKMSAYLYHTKATLDGLKLTQQWEEECGTSFHCHQKNAEKASFPWKAQYQLLQFKFWLNSALQWAVSVIAISSIIIIISIAMSGWEVDKEVPPHTPQTSLCQGTIARQQMAGYYLDSFGTAPLMKGFWEVFVQYHAKFIRKMPSIKLRSGCRWLAGRRGWIGRRGV